MIPLQHADHPKPSGQPGTDAARVATTRWWRGRHRTVCHRAEWHRALVWCALALLCGPRTLAQPSSVWSTPTRVGSSTGPSGGTIYQGLAVDSAATLHAVWVEYQSGFDIFYSRSSDGGATWEAGRDVLAAALPVYSPNLAIGPDDSLHLAWVDRREGGETLLRAVDRWRRPLRRRAPHQHCRQQHDRPAGGGGGSRRAGACRVPRG